MKLDFLQRIDYEHAFKIPFNSPYEHYDASC